MTGHRRRVIPDRSNRWRAALALALSVLLVNAVAGVAPAFDSGAPSWPTRCTSRVPLTAHSEGTLLRHRQWLTTPPDFAGDELSIWRLIPYLVLNTRTGAGFVWRLDSVDRANQQLRFGVLTRWAWLHPGWADDPWVLLYDCPT